MSNVVNILLVGMLCAASRCGWRLQHASLSCGISQLACGTAYAANDDLMCCSGRSISDLMCTAKLELCVCVLCVYVCVKKYILYALQVLVWVC